MRRRTWIAGLALSVAPGCHGKLFKLLPTIRGSGIAKDETRPVGDLHAIQAEDSIEVKVVVKAGDKPSLKLSGDDNLVPLVESSVRDGTLILRLKDDSNASPKLPLLAEVVTSKLDRVEASGAAKVNVSGGSKVERFAAEASGAAIVSVDALETPDAVASASGASLVMLTGSAASLKADASGASQVKASELKVDDAVVSISGASSVALRATKSVTGELSGASRLDLHGRPPKNTVSTSGASQVNQKD